MSSIKELLKVIDETEELNDEIKDKVDKLNIKVQDLKLIKDIPKLKPKLTRSNMSKYEFAATITKLSLYLNTLPSLEHYFNNTMSYNGYINPTEVAYTLLMNGNFDAIIDRLGYEKVSFSQLKINKQWCILLENYFKRNHEALVNLCYKPILSA